MSIRTITTLLLSLTVLGGCASAPPSWTATYHATINSVSGTSRIMASGERVRIESQGQRKTSVSILRYDKGVAWILAPTLGIYREIPLSTLHKDIPLFYDPALKIERTPVGKELLDGRETMKYAAVITDGIITYRGYLWEAIPSLPVPLKWQDERGMTGAWAHLLLEPLADSLFEIPAGYAPAAVEAPDK